MSKTKEEKVSNTEETAEPLKTCFVIMPISDPDGYEVGHFKRVYDFIIKPACAKAGFDPLRADDVYITNDIRIDILKKIVNAEMAVCDLSSRNPNVLYEFGIRQAFNLPVTLMKDKITNRVFDIQGFRDIEYQSSLRADTIKPVVDSLAKAISETYENRDESIPHLLGIEPAKITKTEVTADTGLILEAIANLGKRVSNVEDQSSGIKSSRIKVNDPFIKSSTFMFKRPVSESELDSVKQEIYSELFDVYDVETIHSTNGTGIRIIYTRPILLSSVSSFSKQLKNLYDFMANSSHQAA